MRIRSMLGTMVMVAASVALPAFAAERVVEDSKLSAMAREARTAQQHAAVAKQYRLRAESFDARAQSYEQSAKSRAKAAGAMMHKWPAMVPPAVQEDKQKAVDSRRAAQENRERAEFHLRESVEALGVSADNN